MDWRARTLWRGSGGCSRQRIAPLLAVFAVGAGALAIPAPAGAATGPDAIQLENSLPGDASWVRTEAPANVIDGYGSEVSVLPGGTVHLHVSTQRAGERYRVIVYRMGWYGGKGARLMGCLPSCTGADTGNPKPIPAPDPSTGRIDAAGWPVTDTMQVGSNWVSGYYFAELVLVGPDNPGNDRVVPFVVRAPAGNRSAVLVQAAVNTWQAYNGWGGRSLYGSNPAVKVSFNRPYNDIAVPASYELPFVRFAEREGYDTTYTTDVDTDANPTSLAGHRLVISLGHDEYWSKAMRDAFENLRNAGVNLAFIGADIGDWQMRYEDGERTIVEYRSAKKDPEPNPALKTVRFRDLSPSRPECQLLGSQFESGFDQHKGPEPERDLAAVGVADPWFANTGFTPGAAMPGSVGDEWDAVVPRCAVPPLTILFQWQGKPSDADSVRYTATSGARVFSSATLQFVWTLDALFHAQADPRAEHFMRNVVSDLATAPPGPAPPPLAPPGRTPLSLSSLKVRSARARRGTAHRSSKKSRRRSIQIRLGLSAPANVLLWVARIQHGTDQPVGSLTLSVKAGTTAKRLPGRLAGHQLTPGSYRAVAIALDGAGEHAVAQARFRVRGR